MRNKVHEVTGALTNTPTDKVDEIIEAYFKACLVSMVSSKRFTTPLGSFEVRNNQLVLTSTTPLVEQVLRTPLSKIEVLDLIDKGISCS